jgi:serine protease AprX
MSRSRLMQEPRVRCTEVRRLAVMTAMAAAVVSALLAGVSWGASSPDTFALAGIGSDAHRSTAPRGVSGSVIVVARPGRVAIAEAEVRRLGGRVTTQLPIIDGFTAYLPRAAAAPLVQSPAVLSVTPNRVLQPMSSGYDPVSDVGSPYNTTQITGAQSFWQAGYTGRGVDVALIDSGVAPVDGLSAPGKIVNGPDLSEESQGATVRYMDTYGHGTFMAGLIAGRAAAATPGAYVGDSSDYLGMAPDARIVSVKVADAHGATDVSQVIAAIDWVVQHKNDNGLNIRVLNLSYGTDSSQDYTLDPLAFAAEQAWRSGIVVVAAAGNAGFVKGGSMTDPAADPFVIAAGAADTNGTTTTSDDGAASFSSNGTVARRPDVLAPGVHIVGLRDPGSYIDQTYSSTGAVTAGLFRGSGTSEAAALVSGAVALLLQQRPNLTPDQVKAILRRSAIEISPSRGRGRKELALGNALTEKTPGPGASQTFTPADGSGLLEVSRGSVHVSQNGIALTGEQDIFGKPFLSAPMAALEAAGSSWSGGIWNGSSWSGNSWSGNSWSGNGWSGNSWSGNSWSGNSWSGNSWSGNSWSGNTWSGSSWSTTDFSGQNWADNAWADATWN